MNIADLWKYELRKGPTDHPANGACLFDAGMWLLYGKIGDDPPCSCPVIRRYAISLNDYLPDAERQRLKPYILRVVGNRDPQNELARQRYIVLETARRIVPIAFDMKWPAIAAELRALPDDISYQKMRDVMQAAKDTVAYNDAAYAALSVAYAAAYAAGYVAYAGVPRAAYAVSHAALSVADDAVYAAGAADAAYAAYVAAYAADTAAARLKPIDSDVWQEAINILNGVLRIGKQSPEFDESEVRSSIERFEVARRNMQHAR